MANSQFSSELENYNKKGKNFLLFNLVFVFPIIYGCILLLFDTKFSSNDHPYTPIFILDFSSRIDLIFIIFLGISFSIIFATYWLFLPMAKKKYQDKGYNESFFNFLLMFTINHAIFVYGLIVGILSSIINNYTDWWKCLVFVGIGLPQIIYLYGWKIPKDFRKFSFKSSKK